MRYIPLLLVGLVAITTSSCNGIFAGIYDAPPTGSESDEGFSVNQSRPDRMTLKVDASGFGTWIYVSLKNKTLEKFAIPLTCEGEWDGKSGISYYEVKGSEYTFLSETPTSPQPAPADWDFAIHRFDVRTNHGACARTSLRSIDKASTLKASTLDFTPDSWGTHSVMVDLSEMMAYRIGYQNISSNPVMSDWVTMDISTPPPVFTATGSVYIMRLEDGTMAAMQMRSYVNQHGLKGYLTIDIVYPLDI